MFKQAAGAFMIHVVFRNISITLTLIVSRTKKVLAYGTFKLKVKWSQFWRITTSLSNEMAIFIFSTDSKCSQRHD